MVNIKKKIRVFDGFTGYGGASWGLKKAGIPFEVIGYSEICPMAIELYELNHPPTKNYGDITKIDPKNLPDFDLFTGGFPCQTFSTAGKGMGELDTRGTLFYDIIRICEEKKPDYILLENVKGLLSKRHEATFKKIISELQRIGYNVRYELLNSKDFGIPQNRERVWIFGTRKKIPEGWKLSPPKESLKLKFKDFLDKNVDDKYYKNEKQADRLEEVTGVKLKVNEPTCLDVYNKKLKKDGLCLTITEPHHNTLRVVEPNANRNKVVRKMTEREQFRFMGFDDQDLDFGEMSYTRLSKCAGNGWDVNLVSKIMKQIIKLFD